EQRPITLQEAMDLALKNSKQLRISRAKIREAAAELTQAQQGQLPDLKISGSYLRLTQPNIDIDPSLSKAMSSGSGGSGSGSSGASGSSASGGLSSIKVHEAMYGMANLSLPLFSGF